MAPTHASSDQRDEGLDLAAIEQRWQRAWQERKVYEADPKPDQEKFFCTYPYSYMNAYAHIGHGYTMLRNDIMARFQRMLGKNVLFPFAYHVTGTPIVAAANRIREGEETQVRQLELQGIDPKDVPKFADPLKWVDFFPQQWRQDVDRLGLAVDWRRQFHTTDMNPFYDAFVRWQFRRLKETGRVRRGRHPVVWDPVDEAVLSDHDRVEGEGETPQEYTLIKLRDASDPERVFVAATLRPETMFGQTNVWVDPEATYTEVRVGGERWIVGKPAAHKLPYQFEGAEVLDVDVPGQDLVGTWVKAPATDRSIPILPATFVSAETGTGVVTSVPSDAPDDHRALLDVQADDELLERFELNAEDIRAIEPIAIIDTPELGDLPAPKLIEEWGIESQQDRVKLQEAKEEVYKKGFYGGHMKEGLPVVGGKPVREAKEAVQAWLVENDEAAIFYDLTGKVVARSLSEAVVKIVDDQWFLGYGDEDWKQEVHEAFDEIVRCYPEKVETQFDHVIDWLNDWACARSTGLGTHLPWDERWIIESLSDSTIYMAYYTMAHILESGEVDPDDIRDNDAAFDYILLGKGSKSEATRGTLTEERLERMRHEFEYWYPLDFRNSGKDLVQNHLTFMVFNHTAIFSREHWPRGISVNGWVTVDGEKMSKSQGNFITLREALDEHGATVTRMALANAGEGLDDANFSREFAGNVGRRLVQWFRTATEEPENAHDGEAGDAEQWLLSRLSEIVDEARSAYDGAAFRTALKAGFFDTAKAWNWYLRRSLGRVHRETWQTYASVVTRLMAPLIPHLASEAWERQGGQGLVIDAPFPQLEPPEGAQTALAGESLVEQVLDDVRDILKVTGTEPEVVRIFTAPPWKQTVLATALEQMEASGQAPNPGQLTGAVMQDGSVKRQGGQAARFAKDLAIQLQRGEVPLHGIDETKVLEAANDFLAEEIGAPVEVYQAGAHGDVEHGGKADRAEPGRPGLYVAG